jgi:hypothetical protein
MEIKLIFPAIVFYTQSNVRKHTGYIVRGKAAAFLIFINAIYKYDKGLLAHELTHVKQWWTRGLLIHNILYGAIPRYRLWAEAKAYHTQWRYSPTPEKKEDFADRIWLFYGLAKYYSRERINEYFSKFFTKEECKTLKE